MACSSGCPLHQELRVPDRAGASSLSYGFLLVVCRSPEALHASVIVVRVVVGTRSLSGTEGAVVSFGLGGPSGRTLPFAAVRRTAHVTEKSTACLDTER